MIYEHYCDCFMNTFMNTLQKKMNTMNTFKANISLFSKKIHPSYHIINRKFVSKIGKSVHSIHYLERIVHIIIHKISIKSIIKGGAN